LNRSDRQADILHPYNLVRGGGSEAQRHPRSYKVMGKLVIEKPDILLPHTDLVGGAANVFGQFPVLASDAARQPPRPKFVPGS
jgi:hypothetical protein